MELPINTNSKYYEVNLKTLIDVIGEDRANEILSSFSCPKNKDVEKFLREKAVLFTKRDFSQTHLVFWVSEDSAQKELVGYYALALKTLSVAKDCITNTQARKFREQGIFNSDRNTYTVPASLIGQLGKNYQNGNDVLITGDELLDLAVSRIKKAQHEIGGRFVYLECEDKKKLLEFYQRNGFRVFGNRRLDKDETGLEGEYLVQLLMIT